MKANTNENKQVSDMEDNELKALIRTVIHEEVEGFIRGENPNEALAEYFEFLREEIAAQKKHRKYVEKVKMSAIGWLTIVVLGGLLTSTAWLGRIVWQHFMLRGF